MSAGHLVCNNFDECKRKGEDSVLDEDFLVCSCGHAFCAECAQLVCNAARCPVCNTELTEDMISTSNPSLAPQLQLSLFGLDSVQLNAMAGRALQFQIGQLELRIQQQAERYCTIEKKYTRLQKTDKEIHSKNTTAMSILEGRLNDALKELEAERARTATFQKRMQEELRQKRRLEEESQQRKWQRSSLLATALKAPVKAITSGTDTAAAERRGDKEDIGQQKLHSANAQSNSRFFELPQDENRPRQVGAQAPSNWDTRSSIQAHSGSHPSDSYRSDREGRA